MSAFHCAMGKGSYLQVSYWLLLYYLVPFLFSLHLDYVFLHTPSAMPLDEGSGR